MAVSNVRELAPAQEFPQTAGLAVGLLGTIADCIEPAEADILIEPLRELAEGFASAAPGSLFKEWAPPRQPLEEDVELHRAQAFAEPSSDSTKYPPAAALGRDSDTKWVSSSSKDPSKWTLKLAEPVTGIHAVTFEFATDDSIVKPSKVTVETSSDGFKFKAAGKPVTIKGDDEDGDDDSEDDKDDSGDGGDNPFHQGSEGTKGHGEDARVSVPSSRKVQFIRITMEGEAGSAAAGSVKHGLVRVRLLRVRPDPLRTTTAQVLSTVVRACAVAGAGGAPTEARVAAIQALLAIAAATSSTQAATLAMAITSQHLVAGGTSLPGSVTASLSSVVKAATTASMDALAVAATSGHASSVATALEKIAGLGASDDSPSVEPKFDTRNHGSRCEIRNGGRLWHSTGGSENWAMAKTGIKKGMIATWEFEVTEDESNDEQTCLGFSRKTVDNGSYQSSSDLWMVRCYNGQCYHDGSSHPSVDNIHPGDIARFRANMKKGTVELWINGEKQNDGDPIFKDLTGTIHPAVCGYSSGKETKFRSYKIEGGGESSDGVPVLATSFPALLQAIKATKGATAPFLGAGSSSSGPGVVVGGKAQKSVLILRPDGSAETGFGKKRGDDDDEAEEAEVPKEVADTLAPVVEGQVALQFSAKDAVAGLKKKPPANTEVCSFSASFSASPKAPHGLSAACSVAEVVVNGRVQWRSAPIHAAPELTGTPTSPLSLQTCTVPAGIDDTVCVVVRKGVPASEAASSAAAGAGAGTSAAAAAAAAGDGDGDTTITPVVMSRASFGMRRTGTSLKAFLPDPSEAVDAVFAKSDAASLGSQVSPLLCQGGGLGTDGVPAPTVPTAQFLAELTAALTACAQAEAAVTKAAVACVGVGGSRVTAKELQEDEEADKSGDKDGKERDGPTGKQKAELLARLLSLEAPLALEASDASVLALAEGVEVALGLALPDSVRDRVALTLTAQAAVLLGRAASSGLPPRSLGLTLPGSATAKSSKALPATAASGAGAGAGSEASTCALDRLRVALDRFESDDVTSSLPLAASSALSAVDAGTALFYPTKALRDALLSRLLAGGATMELQVRFPSLSQSALDSTVAGVSTSSKEALAAWPAEAHPSMRDSRFDRLVSLVQASAGQAGFRCEVRGRWGGWLHLLVALPAAEASAAKATATATAAAQFVSVELAGCMKRAGMGLWRFPSGCTEPAIGVEVRRSRVVSEDDRRFTTVGHAVVRLFPAVAGSFDAIIEDVDSEIKAFEDRIRARGEEKSSEKKKEKEKGEKSSDDDNDDDDKKEESADDSTSDSGSIASDSGSIASAGSAGGGGAPRRARLVARRFSRARSRSRSRSPTLPVPVPRTMASLARDSSSDDESEGRARPVRVRNTIARRRRS